jgi:hypothetical protein
VIREDRQLGAALTVAMGATTSAGTRRSAAALVGERAVLAFERLMGAGWALAVEMLLGGVTFVREIAN